jgi:formylglycine-generating enzyme required for sulfatase activity/serine/threonine protein kinase
MNASGSDHPTDQTLRAYGVGKLHGDLADSVQAHLGVCAGCRQRVAELSADTFLDRLRGAQARPDAPVQGEPPFCDNAVTERNPNAIVPLPADSIPPGLAEHSDYDVLGELGRGGMGVVYLAWNKLMGRKEVLKVVSRELMDRRGVLDRFLREIRNAAQLHHTNIVTAYSAIRAGESIVFAMEYVEGHDLAQLVKRNGPLPVVHACNFINQAALGLQYGHEKGMVHRDIKPSNLILARHGKKPVVKILDFGLAKATREGPLDKGLTQEGQMLGTPDYIAPEQSLDATKADIRADIYSLGCTLYYLLNGGPPFGGASLYEVLQAHHSMEAKPLNLVRPEVPWELAAVVARMMAKDPGRRYQTPAEVAQALKPFFKAGESGPVSSKTEVSRAGEAPAVERLPHPRSPAATNVATASPAPPAPRRLESTQAEPKWQSLIAIDENEASSATAKPVAPWWGRRRPPWIWPAVAVGVLLLALSLAWLARDVTIKTNDGVIVLENAPENAVVEVDGRKVAIGTGKGEPMRIEFKPGTHGVVVKLGSDPLLVESVTLEPGKQCKLVVRVRNAGENQPSQTSTQSAQPRVPESVARWMSRTTKLELVRIEGGEFLMGSPATDRDAEDDERPQHRVRISSFYLGVTEVTQEQYLTVMGNFPSWFSSSGGGKDAVAGRPTGQLPVEQVTWFDAVAFCNVLSEKDGLDAYYDIRGDDVRIRDPRGPGYRLPTEAEWEYACRAGTSTRYCLGDDPSGLGDFAWYRGNSSGLTHLVRQRAQNKFGLYDMHGNVWEWCWDGYDGAYYGRSRPADPPGPSPAAYRMGRGGGWSTAPGSCRSAARSRNAPTYRYRDLGFRLALNHPTQGAVRSAAAQPEERQPPGTAQAPPQNIQNLRSSTDAELSASGREPATWTSPLAKITLVRIEGEELLMGSPDSDRDAQNDEKPQHRVHISPVYFGVTEVTQSQYQTVMGDNPSWFSPSGGGKVADRPTGQLPVEYVSWFDAVRFCNALSKEDGFDAYYDIRGHDVRIRDPKGLGYRLPTEAEWEYACRACTSMRYYFGDDPAGLGDFAWYRGNSSGLTHLVRQRARNKFGLYDMHGNVWEWCWDHCDGDFDGRSPAANPHGPSGAPYLVIRGGGWLDDPHGCRSAIRLRRDPAFRSPRVGFRVARNQPARGGDKMATAKPEPRVPPESTQAPPHNVQNLGSSADRQPSSSRHEPATWVSPFAKITFVRIEGGEFLMGSPATDREAGDNEKPQHPVRVTRAFYLGVTEVTRGPFRLFVDDTGYKTEAEKDGKGCYGLNEETGKFEQNPKFTWQSPGFEQSDEHPVVNVSWNDAQEFITWLSKREAKEFRLPTEAEWKYACRAGTTTAYFSCDDPESLASVGNVKDGTAKERYPDWATIAARDNYVYTAPVGRFRANAYGLYDMHGNVWEWCADWFDKDYYKQSPRDDPRGPAAATNRAIRGGSYDSAPRDCRSAYRGRNGPAYRDFHLDFRLARNDAAAGGDRPATAQPEQRQPPESAQVSPLDVPKPRSSTDAEPGNS